jgi:tetratricopeptide (TPR) repeat protein
MPPPWLERWDMHGAEEQRKIIAASQDAQVWIRQGNELMFKGDFAKAVQAYDKALEADAGSAKALHYKANALEAQGLFEDAIRCYDSAIRCDPGDAECWFNKGVTLKKAGRADEGNRCIDNGVHIAMGLE